MRLCVIRQRYQVDLMMSLCSACLSYIAKVRTISPLFCLTLVRRGTIYVSGEVGFYPYPPCTAIVEYSSIILEHRKTNFNIWCSAVSLTKSSDINYSRIHLLMRD